MSISLKQLAERVPVLRGFAHTVPPYLTGSLLENRLGLQPIRAIGKHIAWRLRNRGDIDTDIRDYIAALDRDGVLVIPNFLEEEAFRLVRQEYDELRNGMSFNSLRQVNGGRLEVANFDLNGGTDTCGAIARCLQQNPLILKIAGNVIRRRSLAKPLVRISVYRKSSDTAPDNDIENVLHADLHTPTVKAFYYLNDIDESNGAFVYVKGSHRMSLRRLRYEYNISVRTAKLKKGDSVPPHLIAVRGANRRSVISEEYLDNLVETPICGKANTLVISNNMGFHRRGTFTGEKIRETIIINFRLFEKCFWVLTLLIGAFEDAMSQSQ